MREKTEEERALRREIVIDYLRMLYDKGNTEVRKAAETLLKILEG